MAIAVAYMSPVQASELDLKTVQFWTDGVILKIHMIGLC